MGNERGARAEIARTRREIAQFFVVSEADGAADAVVDAADALVRLIEIAAAEDILFAQMILLVYHHRDLLVGSNERGGNALAANEVGTDEVLFEKKGRLVGLYFADVVFGEGVEAVELIADDADDLPRPLLVQLVRERIGKKISRKPHARRSHRAFD